ncbi:MAG: tetratricopeptide repeat protein, partial [Acidobacteriota bacterium]|nr:tetratricopeptide repeat protein [Acidobacteriota bacterium]
MHRLTTLHLDDFTLLRHAANELDGPERQAAARHLESCRSCSSRSAEVIRLDGELRALARENPLAAEPDSADLPQGDPFRARPVFARERRRERPPSDQLTGFALRASEAAVELQARILERTGNGRRLGEMLDGLDLRDPSMRYAILYALQDSGRQIAAGPTAALRFAEAVLGRLRREPAALAGESEAETLVPLVALRGHAHLLAGQACNWSQDFERSKTHLALAYRGIAMAGGDEVALAIVEHIEAQRRFLLDRGAEALVLARRALASFQAFGLEDLSAKAQVAVGSALATLGREEEALPLLSEALRVFESRGLWSNYVGALNNLGACYQRLGRLDEARREYARALRRLSRTRDASFLAVIRHGLAEVLFSAERYREAAGAFSQAARLYADKGFPANALGASLFEIESWARSGDTGRARHRLELFQAEVARSNAL